MPPTNASHQLPPTCPGGERRACHLLRKHALAPFAAPAGLPATARCVFVFLAYAAALEASHALRLAPTVHRETWPVLEQVGGWEPYRFVEMWWDWGMGAGCCM